MCYLEVIHPDQLMNQVWNPTISLEADQALNALNMEKSVKLLSEVYYSQEKNLLQKGFIFIKALYVGAI